MDVGIDGFVMGMMCVCFEYLVLLRREKFALLLLKLFSFECVFEMYVFYFSVDLRNIIVLDLSMFDLLI